MNSTRCTLHLPILWAPWLGLALVLSALGTEPSTETNPSVRLSAPRYPADGSFEFSIEDLAGRSCQVSVSSNLVDWSLLTNVLAGVSTVVVADTHAAQHARRFYRVGPPTVVPITNMVFISPGTFTMGSPTNELDRESDESPQTQFTISRGFWLGKYEVTQREYQAVMGANPSRFNTDLNQPVEQVSWSDATNYCAKLSGKERAASRLPPGYVYRLPTEAEWEYACRAGTTTATTFGNQLSSTQANFDGSSPYNGAPTGPYLRSTAKVGSYTPNAWGLYDMHGNVWEWCADRYGIYPGDSVTDSTGPSSGSDRVHRGGGWSGDGKYCRSADRSKVDPRSQSFLLGFRVALVKVP